MLKYIDVNDYMELLGEEDIPSNFNSLVIEASQYVNAHTFGRIDENNIPEEVKYATALIVRETATLNKKIDEISNLKSQNIAGWSETYQTPDELQKNIEDKKTKILKENLWNVIGVDGQFLLYKGVG